MNIDCAACGNNFKTEDKAVKSDCGHLVHCYKVDCCEKNFCLQCNKEFIIDSNASIVTLKSNNEWCVNDDGEKRLNSSRMKEAKETVNDCKCDERHEFYKEKFEEQRTINLEIIKKVKSLVSNQECLSKVISEQTHNFVVIVEGLTKMSPEVEKLKIDVSDLTEQVVDLLQEVFSEEELSQC